MKTRYALAIIAAAVATTSAIDAHAASLDSFLSDGLAKAQRRVEKAQDRVSMWTGCKTDPAPCIADAKARLEKRINTSKSKLADLDKLSQR